MVKKVSLPLAHYKDMGSEMEGEIMYDENGNMVVYHHDGMMDEDEYGDEGQ